MLPFYIIIILIVVIIIKKHYFILILLKHVFGKDFPIKEHDIANKFLNTESNIFDKIYYKYSDYLLNRKNKKNNVNKENKIFKIPSININQIGKINTLYKNNSILYIILNSYLKLD